MPRKEVQTALGSFYYSTKSPHCIVDSVGKIILPFDVSTRVSVYYDYLTMLSIDPYPVDLQGFEMQMQLCNDFFRVPEKDKRKFFMIQSLESMMGADRINERTTGKTHPIRSLMETDVLKEANRGVRNNYGLITQVYKLLKEYKEEYTNEILDVTDSFSDLRTRFDTLYQEAAEITDTGTKKSAQRHLLLKEKRAEGVLREKEIISILHQNHWEKYQGYIMREIMLATSKRSAEPELDFQAVLETTDTVKEASEEIRKQSTKILEFAIPYLLDCSEMDILSTSTAHEFSSN